ncbi:Na+/H+ antiporter, subunit MnhC [Thermogladius calderae 1633]|uniref:Na+/H+ antiporter, subunit MnhC n=1 Tax=Thermogladius calderae (strain DSM 22663 / VKM B-2946 / 1633) TaxID=1184251 RepID=I3TG04_THEC1|nr:sodium:proton antiporter [Thermogladius calderae]AFK51692.1 Na+/H+ antiporter, subunit MnhC [Thermogladius calderae 1633]
MVGFLAEYMFTVIYLSLFVNLGLTLFGLFYKPHYIKKLIMLSILGDTLNMFTIFLGYRAWPTPTTPSRPPILLTYPFENTSVLVEFTSRAVDPLPQALVLTAVVIGLAVMVFLIFLGDNLFKHYGTLDMREIRRLRG